MRGLRRLVIRAVLAREQLALKNFQQALAHPVSAQQQALQRILQQVKGSAFAKTFGLDQVRDQKDFKTALPIAGYDRMAPFIERVMRGEKTALLSQHTKICMMAMTSGTTTPVKYIPVTRACLTDYRRSWTIWGCALAADFPEIPYGKILSLASHWQAQVTASGIPCGSISGFLAQTMHRILRRSNALPIELQCVESTRARYYVALKIALSAPDIRLINTASPSTLVGLARQLGEQFEALLRDMYDGTISAAQARDALSSKQKHLLRPWLTQRCRQRAQALRKIAEKAGTLTPRLVWPQLCALGVWTGGTLSPYLPRLTAYYGDVPWRDHGLSASEGRMTIPLDDGRQGGVLNILGPYFEFIPVSAYGQTQPPVLAAHELIQGACYNMVVSTTGGLCRYDMADIVQCTGFMQATPIVKFLHKASHIANLTGEKLSEFQVATALRQLVGEHQSLTMDIALAPVSGDPPSYYFVVEERYRKNVSTHLLQRLDRLLSEQNIEYHAKRTSQRLGSIGLATVDAGTWQRWQTERLQKGGTMEQYKHPFLLVQPAHLLQVKAC